MKTRLYLLAALCIGAMSTLTSCDDDNDFTPESAIIKAFEAMFPQAGKVNWEVEKGYNVAEFRQDGTEMEAWFDGKGNWLMTESDIRFEALPEAVKTTFNASEYKTGWTIEDVDKIERVEMAVVFIIEVEKGDQDVDLHYAEDGTLIKTVADDNSPNVPELVNEVILRVIAEKYPNAVILEVDVENNLIEVDILDGKLHKEVIFNQKNEWLSTSWEVLQSNVPAVVMNAFNSSEYKNYKIDDIDFYETPLNSYYLFELDKEPTDIYLMITEDGQVSLK